MLKKFNLWNGNSAFTNFYLKLDKTQNETCGVISLTDNGGITRTAGSRSSWNDVKEMKQIGLSLPIASLERTIKRTFTHVQALISAEYLNIETVTTTQREYADVPKWRQELARNSSSCSLLRQTSTASR